jgi:hypothetical protein
LRGGDRQPASEARRDDASFIAEEEQSDGGNEQPRVAFRKNAVDEPSENEGPQKSERAAKSEREETRGMQFPDGTNLCRQPAKFDGNDIRK